MTSSLAASGRRMFRTTWRELGEIAVDEMIVDGHAREKHHDGARS